MPVVAGHRAAGFAVSRLHPQRSGTDTPLQMRQNHTSVVYVIYVISVAKVTWAT